MSESVNENETPEDPLSPLEQAMIAAAQRRGGSGSTKQSKSRTRTSGSEGSLLDAEDEADQPNDGEDAAPPATPAEQDAPSAEESSTPKPWTPAEHPAIPLLPRGKALFDAIPSRAVVLDALSPAIGNGMIVLTGDEQLGVVLVHDGAIGETFAFSDGNRLNGSAAMQQMQQWEGATVAAFRFPEDVVATAPTLLHGQVCYPDLSLRWTDWRSLLADLRSRAATFVVEMETPHGRGATWIRSGEQIATYTDHHPELGEASLLESLAGAKDGTIWVLSDTPMPQMQTATTTTANNGAAPAAQSPPEQEPKAASGGALESPVPNPFATRSAPAAAPQPAHEFVPVPRPSDLTPSAPPAGGQPPSAAPQPTSNAALTPELADELKEIARQRLQRSASRIETLLDQASAVQRPVDDVLSEVRGLVIRGVMQSTLDSVVDEMEATAARAA